MATINEIRKLFVFNRFPINADVFMKLLQIGFKVDLFEPLASQFRVFEKIYYTMSDQEMNRIAIRRGDPELLDYMYKHGWDAAYSIDAKCIVFHAPAMMNKIAEAPLRSDDSEGKMLFTIHFFCCLFHELAHAKHYMVLKKEAISGDEGSLNTDKYSMTALEEYAEKCELEHATLFWNTMNHNGFGTMDVAEMLFDWNKLKPIFDKARTSCINVGTKKLFVKKM